MDELFIDDRLILNTEISDSFRISIQERLDSGMKRDRRKFCVIDKV